MIFEINLTIKVDPTANFLETFGDNRHVISQLVSDSLYDIDDIKILKCEVEDDK